MRIATVLTLIGAAAVSFSASAAPAANTNVDTSMNSVPVSAHSAYKLTRDELAGLQGAYALDDGRVLRVTTHQNHLYADLDGARTEIVPVAYNKFASSDDAVRLVFNGTDKPTMVQVSTIAR